MAHKRHQSKQCQISQRALFSSGTMHTATTMQRKFAQTGASDNVNSLSLRKYHAALLPFIGNTLRAGQNCRRTKHRAAKSSIWRPQHFFHVASPISRYYFNKLFFGRMAQLVRAPRSHRGDRWFESSCAHYSHLRCTRFATGKLWCYSHACCIEKRTCSSPWQR